MSPIKAAVPSLTIFFFVILINGGPDDPVRGGPLVLAVLLAAATYTALRYLIPYLTGLSRSP